MNLESTRRVMETTSHETANQYLRFGWNLINQYVVEATAEHPAMVRYVLASVRRLEDTRQVVTLTDPAAVNDHLEAGWKLIDKYVTTDENATHRQETLTFLLAWQNEDPPPGSSASTNQIWIPATDSALDSFVELDEVELRELDEQ